MIPPPLARDEAWRLAELRRLELLDTEPERAFDDAVAIAAQIAGTPIALLSLVDQERQWFKAAYGLEVRETPRDVSFCGHAVAQAAPLIVPDALEDPRFFDNPLVVCDPNIRFYAGFQLCTAASVAVGTLCVIDRVPRTLSPEQLAALTRLARLTSDRLEGRWRQRQADAERRDFDDFLQNASDLILSMDPDGRLTYVNRSWRATLGWDLAAHPGLNMRDLVAPEDQEAWDHACRTAADEGTVHSFEVTLVAQSGRRVLVEGSLSLRLHDGEVVALRAFLRDTTSRRRAEASARESGARLEAFFDSAPVLLGIVDLVGDDDMRHVQDNPATERFFGAPQGATRGRLASELGAPHAIRRMWCDAYLASRSSGRPHSFAYQHEDRWLEVTVAVVDGHPNRYCYVASDITRRREAELQRDLLDRHRSEFVAHVSHEIRTPLAAIHAALRLLLVANDGRMDESSGELLTIASNNTERLARLVGDVLDLERIRSGILEVRRRVVDLRGTLRQAVSGLRPLAAERSIEPRLTLNLPPGIAIDADEDWVTEVMVNLVGNALKYAGEGADVQVSASLDHGEVRVEVRDDGPGIPESQLSRLFDRFTRGSHADSAPGSGLGLAISKALVERSGGRIGAWSSPGEGTTLWFVLPVAPTA